MWLFNGITNLVVRATGHDPAKEHEVYTDEEIKLLIDESTESGLIDPEQNEYVDNIFDLGDKDAEAIMTPRMDMICLDTEDTLEENLALIHEHKYTRYPCAAAPRTTSSASCTSRTSSIRSGACPLRTGTSASFPPCPRRCPSRACSTR